MDIDDSNSNSNSYSSEESESDEEYPSDMSNTLSQGSLQAPIPSIGTSNRSSIVSRRNENLIAPPMGTPEPISEESQRSDYESESGFSDSRLPNDYNLFGNRIDVPIYSPRQPTGPERIVKQVTINTEPDILMDETAANIEDSVEDEPVKIKKKVEFEEMPDLFKETMKEKVSDHMSIYTDTRIEKFFKKWCPCCRNRIAKWKNKRIKREEARIALERTMKGRIKKRSYSVLTGGATQGEDFSTTYQNLSLKKGWEDGDSGPQYITWKRALNRMINRWHLENKTGQDVEYEDKGLASLKTYLMKRSTRRI